MVVPCDGGKYGPVTRHKIPRIAIPPEWPRFLGLDFGGVNTAGIFFAQERDAYHKPTARQPSTATI